jgi:hypothetical protein
MACGNSENRGTILALKAVLKPQLRIVAQAAVSTSDKRVAAPQRFGRIAAKLELSVDPAAAFPVSRRISMFTDSFRRFEAAFLTWLAF